MRRNRYVLANRRHNRIANRGGINDLGLEEWKMKKAFDSILVLGTLGVCATAISLLAIRSLPAAMVLTWAPVALGGTYAIGKAKGRRQ